MQATATRPTNGRRPEPDLVICPVCTWTGLLSDCDVHRKRPRPGSRLARSGITTRHYICPRCAALIRVEW